MAKKPRDYRDEYRKFQSSKEEKHNRALRNKNRREFEREGKVHKKDGLDIDHVSGDPKNNSRSNLRVIPKGKNRGKH
jgi:predicted N-acyltransferase